MWDSNEGRMEIEGLSSFDIDVRRCLHVLGFYLAAITCQGSHQPVKEHRVGVLETGMEGTRYCLRFLCGTERSRRITVVMDKPYPQQFVVGRLLANGSSRLCQTGACLFVGYLMNEGLLEDFMRDLEESLLLCALPEHRRPRQMN
ncbi:hypothetical protein [Desulfovibrio ferrophilus]|nr:hypothetical protein [Desulfovibrio ferrophilus]